MINTDVKLWFGWKIDATNCYLDYRYSTDLSDRLATLRFGRYSSSTLCDEIERALLEVGVTSFSVAFDRASKKFSVTNSVAFNVLSHTGVSIGAGGAWGYLGFSSASDKTGAMTYTADSACLPFEYIPQFKLQSLTKPGDSIVLRDAQVSESSSGEVQLTHYGEILPVEFEIVFVTNIPQISGSVIKNNPTGKEDLNTLLEWATKKGLVEFIEDSNYPENSVDLILTATELSQNGTDYKLYEQYAKGLPNVFSSGLLKWRVYES